MVKNAILNNSRKFENNSINSMQSFYIAVTMTVVIAMSRVFLTTIYKTRIALVLSPPSSKKIQVFYKCSDQLIYLNFKYFYCNINCRYTVF